MGTACFSNHLKHFGNWFDYPLIGHAAVNHSLGISTGKYWRQHSGMRRCLLPFRYTSTLLISASSQVSPHGKAKNSALMSALANTSGCTSGRTAVASSAGTIRCSRAPQRNGYSLIDAEQDQGHCHNTVEYTHNKLCNQYGKLQL